MSQNKIRVYFYDKQKWGNYQIRLGKKKDIEHFKEYIESYLKPLNHKIGDYRKDLGRRYYVEEEHIEFMSKDDLIDLKAVHPIGWKAN